MSLKELCYQFWDDQRPKTFRQARVCVEHYNIQESTLMVYFTHWRKKEGLSKPRPHRRKHKDE